MITRELSYIKKKNSEFGTYGCCQFLRDDFNCYAGKDLEILINRSDIYDKLSEEDIDLWFSIMSKLSLKFDVKKDFGLNLSQYYDVASHTGTLSSIISEIKFRISDYNIYVGNKAVDAKSHLDNTCLKYMLPYFLYVVKRKENMCLDDVADIFFNLTRKFFIKTPYRDKESVEKLRLNYGGKMTTIREYIKSICNAQHIYIMKDIDLIKKDVPLIANKNILITISKDDMSNSLHQFLINSMARMLYFAPHCMFVKRVVDFVNMGYEIDEALALGNIDPLSEMSSRYYWGLHLDGIYSFKNINDIIEDIRVGEKRVNHIFSIKNSNFRVNLCLIYNLYEEERFDELLDYIKKQSSSFYNFTRIGLFIGDNDNEHIRLSGINYEILGEKDDMFLIRHGRKLLYVKKNKFRVNEKNY